MPHSLSDYNDAMDWINTIISISPNTSTQHIPKERKHDRIKHLLSLFDNPQNDLKSIHITGSKGKSSTGNACSYILQQYDIRAGLFTSPHIHEYTERIKINHSNVEKDIFVFVLNEIYQCVTKHNIYPSMFEVLFTAACIIFKRKEVQYAIFEVGIGGRYDTTNIIFPVASIITNIEKEHTDILGHTIEEIVYDKAGIIKHKTPVFVERQTTPSILPIIQNYATKQSAPYYYIPDHITIQSYERNEPKDASGNIPRNKQSQTRLCLPAVPALGLGNITRDALLQDNHTPIEIKSTTLSPIIIENQMLASIAIHYLLKKPIPEKQVFTHTAQLMCRSELLTLDNTQKIFLDGAHTEQSIRYALQCIETLRMPTILLLALAKGKNYKDISEQILKTHSLIDEIIITTPGCFKESEPHILFQYFKERHKTVTVIIDNKEAMTQAYTKAQQCSHAPLISVLGSFFVAASCRAWCLQKQDIESI